MRTTFNKFIKRTAAGLSALCIVAGTSDVSGQMYTRSTIPANAADEEYQFINGDFNCDGTVDFKDLTDLSKFLKDNDSVTVPTQGLINACAACYWTDSSGIPNYSDLYALIEYLSGLNELGTQTLKSPAKAATVIGDADCDGDIDFDDFIALNNHIQDPENYKLTAEGLINSCAACYWTDSSGEPNDSDRQALIEYLAGLNDLGTQSLKAPPQAVIIGDADCDGDVDFADVDALNNYFADPEKYALTTEGRINACAACYWTDSSGIPNNSDLQAIIEYLGGVNALGTQSLKAPTLRTVIGDVDCDGDVDTDDIETLMNYIKDPKINSLTPQGKSNAMASFYYSSDEPNQSDVQAIAEYLAGVNDLGTQYLKLNPDDISYDLSEKTVYGDFNCDGVVDKNDPVGMKELISYTSGTKISLQSIRNGDVYDPGSRITAEDVQTVVDNINNKTALPVYSEGYLESTYLSGDFNCDNEVNITDAIMLNTYLADKTSYAPSAQGLKNANAFNKDKSGISFEDVIAITECVAGLTKLPTNKLVPIEAEHLSGDFNCDNVVNVTDAIMLNRYLNGDKSYTPSKQGLENADAYNPGSGITIEDVEAITEASAGKYTRPTKELTPAVVKKLPGDFNCDNVFDTSDAIMLFNYIDELTDYTPSERGKANADIYNPGSGLGFDDLDIMLRSLNKQLTEAETVTVTTEPAVSTATTTAKPVSTTTKAVPATTKAAATTTKAAATTTKAAATTTKAAATTKAVATTTKAAATKPATTATKAATTAAPVTTAPVTTTPAYSIGDVNKNGIVDSSDASEVLLAYADLSTGGGSISEELKAIADINKDDMIDSSDASLILEYYSYVSTGGTDSAEKYFSDI